MHESVEAYPHAPEYIERLVRYGEHLASGILPVVEPMPNHHPLPEPTFNRNPKWQEHNLSLTLSGLLVGHLDVNLLEGDGVSQLFINLHYIFPRTYTVASGTPTRLTLFRTTGHSLFVDNRSRAGAVAHVREVFEDKDNNSLPFWALKTIDRFQERPWPVIRTERASDAVGAFQRALSYNALPSIQHVYNEVAAEYGFINFHRFSWQPYRPARQRRII